MHQQLRMRVTGAGTGGSGAMSASPSERNPVIVRRGDLAVVLEEIGAAGINVRVAGGFSIEGSGELVLGVEDDDIDRLEELLRPYHPHRVDVEHADLDDHPGALAEFIRALTNQGDTIDEIYVGSASDGRVPVQVRTHRHASEDATFG